MPTVLARQKRRLFVLASIVAWCDQRFRDLLAPLVRAGRSGSQTGDLVGNAASSPESPDPPRYSYDASLLFRRMKLHQIDHTHLAEHHPLLFRLMQELCTVCQSKERCVVELDGTMSYHFHIRVTWLCRGMRLWI